MLCSTQRASIPGAQAQALREAEAHGMVTQQGDRPSHQQALGPMGGKGKDATLGRGRRKGKGREICVMQNSARNAVWENVQRHYQ